MSFKIGEISKNKSYIFADVIEILVAINYFGKEEVSKNDIEDIVNKSPISSEEIDHEYKLNSDDEDGSSKHNRLEKQIDDAWILLEHRSYVFNNSYPFKIYAESIKSVNKLSSSQYIYIFILFCSRLKSFSEKGIHQKWAEYFTKLCKYATHGLVPASAEIRIFDANSSDRRNYYGTNLRDAFKILAKDLSVDIHNENLARESTSGDLGLDIVGVYKFEEASTTGNLAIFGQCGAQGENWPDKIYECIPSKYDNLLLGFKSITPVVYTPADYRTANGEWFKTSNTSGVIIIDRRRIIKLLKKSHMFSLAVRDDCIQDFIKDFKKIKFNKCNF